MYSNFQQSEEDIRQEVNLKIFVFICVCIVAFSILLIRLLQLQYFEYENNLKRAEENRIRKVNIKANRGLILDRNGVVLVRNRPSYQISLMYSGFKNKEIRDSVFERLLKIKDSNGKRLLDSAMLSFSFERGRWQKFRFQRLIEDAAPEIVALFEEHSEELPGIEILVESRRDYPFGMYGAHVFGYTSEISEQELELPENAHYVMGDRIGKKGLELSYEQEFRGNNGLRFVEVNAMGREMGIVEGMPFIAPISGNSIVTTLDWRLQKVAENAIPEGLKGAIVALNPQNGEIYAMVSRPPLDPNIFSLEKRELHKAWASVALDTAKPLTNRAISGLYPPASVFKVITAAAGLEANTLSEYTRYKSCGGGLRFGNRYAKCWLARGHAVLNVVGALRESCDVFFYQAGLDMGSERIGDMGRRFGLGSKLGVDIPNERSGLLIDSASYEKWFEKKGWKWSAGEILNIAIGQGALLVTPLQQTVMVGTLAAGNGLYKPHFLKEIVSPEGELVRKIEPEKIGEGKVSERTRNIVLKGLYEVVNAPNGTGRRAIVPGVTVGGKTGSAENPHGDKTHAWFVAVAPLDKPEIAVGVVLENAGGGGAMAAPIAQKVLDAYFNPLTSTAVTE
ncbi:MAG: penicillin-binding protein 2 [Fibromonadaceae bacterium]|jgi:penicillin-binding protein 2|nr:penicillin-binding protein 2 [Fibromonadaceae bacterium]